jgi:acyl-CoA thioesterase FadM
MSGRAHGGFNALILDQITGSTASVISGSFAPATATMTVDYKAPINTPGVVLCRCWAVEKQGRKTWLKARIEDGEGKLLASAKALFIDPKPAKI